MTRTEDNQTSILQHHGLQRLVPLLHGGAKDAQEPTLLLLLALAQGHEQQDGVWGQLTFVVCLVFWA